MCVIFDFYKYTTKKKARKERKIERKKNNLINKLSKLRYRIR